jgi:hypothetical protein
MNESSQDGTPKLATLTIGSSETTGNEQWDDSQREGVISVGEDSMVEYATGNPAISFRPKIQEIGTPASAITGLIKTELEILDLFSGIEAEEKEVKFLHEEDTEKSHYSGKHFRAPESGEFKKLLWTDSLWPCGGLTFFFDVVSCARPMDKNAIPDAYYVPSVNFVPVSRWAIPGCKLTADLVAYKPRWSVGEDGLKRAEITLDVDVHLIKLAVFDWKSRIRFSLSSDSTELNLVNDPIPTPF